MPGELYNQEDVILIKQTSNADLICCEQAKAFRPILETLYDYQWASVPDYNKIIFMFEKIALNMDIVPSNNNLDWLPEIISPTVPPS
jgi:hypothetical protein